MLLYGRPIRKPGKILSAITSKRFPRSSVKSWLPSWREQIHRIVMLPRAVQDLEDIVDYLSQFYTSTAIKQYDRNIEKINDIPP